MKIIFYSFLFFQLFIIPLYADASVKYFKKRSFIRKDFAWVYKEEMEARQATKLKLYYKVTYNSKNQVVKVEFPFYKGSVQGQPLKGKSIETYKEGKIQERKNFIGANLKSFFKYIYNDKGQLRKEEFYKRRTITVFNPNPSELTQTKMIYNFIYYYKKGKISKRACYDSIHNQPVGTWEFYDENGKVIKIIKYRLYPEGGKMKGQIELIIKLVRNKAGNVIVEEQYDGDNYPIVKRYYNDKGSLMRQDEYLDKLLTYRYKYFYRANGTLKKTETWAAGRKISETLFGSKGKKVIQIVKYDDKGKPIKENNTNKGKKKD